MTWPDAFAVVGIAFALGAVLVSMAKWFEREEIEQTKRMELILRELPQTWVVPTEQRQKGDGKGPLA